MTNGETTGTDSTGDEEQWIKWSPLENNADDPSPMACAAIQTAATAASDFDTHFRCIQDDEREAHVPRFTGDEIVRSPRALRYDGYFCEYELRGVRLSSSVSNTTPRINRTVMDPPVARDFAVDIENHRIDLAARNRISERSIDGYYSIRYVQEGLVESDHAINALTEMILDVKILMNLAPHPHLCQIYGVNSGGVDTFVSPGKWAFFAITDRMKETLPDRIRSWRRDQGYGRGGANDGMSKLTQRLEVALDIASALVFLHDRELIFYLRPDKVAFDERADRVKLCYFGQVRMEGMASHAKSITRSLDMQTLAYTAPEVLCKAPATKATDLYAFGVLLWEITTLRSPFQDLDRANHYEHVVQRSERLPMDDDSCPPKELRDLIKACWEPHNRPRMKNVHETLESILLFQSSDKEPSATGILPALLQVRATPTKIDTHSLEIKNNAVNDEESLPSLFLDLAESPVKKTEKIESAKATEQQDNREGTPKKKVQRSLSMKIVTRSYNPVAGKTESDGHTSGSIAMKQVRRAMGKIAPKATTDAVEESEQTSLTEPISTSSNISTGQHLESTKPSCGNYEGETRIESPTIVSVDTTITGPIEACFVSPRRRVRPTLGGRMASRDRILEKNTSPLIDSQLKQRRDLSSSRIMEDPSSPMKQQRRGSATVMTPKSERKISYGKESPPGTPSEAVHGGIPMKDSPPETPQSSSGSPRIPGRCRVPKSPSSPADIKRGEKRSKRRTTPNHIPKTPTSHRKVASRSPRTPNSSVVDFSGVCELESVATKQTIRKTVARRPSPRTQSVERTRSFDSVEGGRSFDRNGSSSSLLKPSTEQDASNPLAGPRGASSARGGESQRADQSANEGSASAGSVRQDSYDRSASMLEIKQMYGAKPTSEDPASDDDDDDDDDDEDTSRRPRVMLSLQTAGLALRFAQRRLSM